MFTTSLSQTTGDAMVMRGREVWAVYERKVWGADTFYAAQRETARRNKEAK